MNFTLVINLKNNSNELTDEILERYKSNFNNIIINNISDNSINNDKFKIIDNKNNSFFMIQKECKDQYFILIDYEDEIINYEKEHLVNFIKKNNPSIINIKNNNNENWGTIFNNDKIYFRDEKYYNYIYSEDKNCTIINYNKININKKQKDKYIDSINLSCIDDINIYFHLAEYYHYQDNKENAIYYYKKRLNQDDNSEEKFISMLRLFRYFKNENDKEALYYSFKMMNDFPTRLEGYYESMMYHFKNNFQEIAHSFGLVGYNNFFLNENENENCLLLEEYIYDFLFLFEFSLLSYRLKKFNLALEASKNKNINFPKPKYFDYEDTHNKNIHYYQLEVDKLESKKSIQKYINPKIQNLHPNIVVIDNFLKDPDERRKFALSQEFLVKGNYPGMRTKCFATDEDKKMIEKALGARISYWPAEYNGSYQICYEGQKSWIHRDLTEYSAIIFLSPDPPITGGTETFMHKELKITYADINENPKLNNRLNKDAGNKDAWDTLDSIGCLYNRLIIFNGMQSHQSRDYFGNNMKNGRLFQVFFFNIEREFPFLKYP